MEPIIAESFGKIDQSQINQLQNEEIKIIDANKLKLKETDGLPRYIDASKLGIYYLQRKQEYRTSHLVGIMPIYVDDKRSSDYYWCIKPSWGDPLKMLDMVLQCDDINDDKIYSFFEPKVKTRKEWIDYCKNEMITGKDSDFLMGIVSDEPEIDLGLDLDGKNIDPQLVADCMNVFEIYDYIIQLEKICKRVLKQQSLPIEENLIGKVKGRVVINKQIKNNLSKGRIDRNYCCYNKMSIDTTENRILKYALYLCKQWSAQRTNFMSDKILYCDNILKNVKLVKVTKADICSVKTNGAFKDYKKGIEKAKRIIHKMAFTFYGESDKQEKEVATRKVKPFFLRIDLLFELYTRVLVKEALKGIDGGYSLEDYSKNETKLFNEDKIYPMGFQNTNIADLLIKDKEGKYICVLDAKYSMLSEGYSSRIRGNTHQLLAYMLIYGAKAGGFIHPINNDEHTLLHRFQTSNIWINKDYMLVKDKPAEEDGDDFSMEGNKVQWRISENFKYPPITINISNEDFKFNSNVKKGEKKIYWISDKVYVEINENDEGQVSLTFTEKKKPPEKPLHSIYAEYKKNEEIGSVYIQQDMIHESFVNFKGIGFSVGLRKPVVGLDSNEKDANIENVRTFLKSIINPNANESSKDSKEKNIEQKKENDEKGNK